MVGLRSLPAGEYMYLENRLNFHLCLNRNEASLLVIVLCPPRGLKFHLL